MDLAADVDWEAAAAVGWLPVAAEGLIAPGGRIVAAVGRGAAAVGARAADEMGSGRGVDNVAPAGACDGPGREVCWWGAACRTPLPPGKSRVLQDPVPAASVTTMERISQLAKPRCIWSPTAGAHSCPKLDRDQPKKPWWVTTAMLLSGLRLHTPPM